ncbi:Hypothetical predicted protein [Paramuricea clavata]|uniref:Uncharacterized protein n=1 Tax=Paramuricea clavata TaxID=317549 RepID=A0A7D9EWW1_PARCT|nr:Hypothetical predicted protein [Paramuricea clavata]
MSESTGSLPVSELVEEYETVLRSLLDTHAPLHNKLVTIRDFSPWYTQEIHAQRIIKRRLERRWRSSNMATDRDLYVKQCMKVNDLIFHSKMSFYGDLIDSLGPDQRNLFSTVDKMIHKKAEKLYPSSGVSGNLANDFANFFCTKITNIRSTLLSETSMNFDYDKTYPIQAELSTFTPVTSENLGKLIDKMSSKSCQLDPIPASVFKKCGHLLLPVITDIVNLSLHHALVPPSLKMALLLPSMKKPSLDHEEFSSFRPISNLKFLSKAVEKVVASQVDTYIRHNNLYEVYQSAYKKYHSTPGIRQSVIGNTFVIGFVGCL